MNTPHEDEHPEEEDVPAVDAPTPNEEVPQPQQSPSTLLVGLIALAIIGALGAAFALLVLGAFWVH